MHCPFNTSQRPLASTGRPIAQASSATIDRLSKYDGMIKHVGCRDAVELVLVWQKAEMMNAWVLRDRHDRAADEHQVEAARKRRGVAQEEVEQLLAALVLVDPPDVDGKRLPDVVLVRGTAARRSRQGISDPIPTTTPGTSSLPVAA